MDPLVENRIAALEQSMRQHTHSVVDSTSALSFIPVVQYETTGSTITPAVEINCLDITALASAVTIANPRFYGVNFQKFMIRIKDDGTARALTWGTAYVAGGFPLPTTTILSKYMTLGFQYCTANALNKWQLIGFAQEV